MKESKELSCPHCHYPVDCARLQCPRCGQPLKFGCEECGHCNVFTLKRIFRKDDE